MSVTFYPEVEDADIVGWYFTCYEPIEKDFVFGDRRDAQAEATKHKTECEMCNGYGVYVMPRTNTPEGINMSNVNARHVLSVLGIEWGDGAGTMPADEFLEHLRFAQVVGSGDEGTVTVEYQEDRGARVIECGRPVGYTDYRLEQLFHLATWCHINQRSIFWA